MARLLALWLELGSGFRPKRVLHSIAAIPACRPLQCEDSTRCAPPGESREPAPGGSRAAGAGARLRQQRAARRGDALG
jgi:hypothetical protein